MQTYQEAIQFLYSQLPAYHLLGPKAYKADLSNTLTLCDHLGHPEKKFKSIHVAGTNGKGSSAHMLAAIFQAAGYKTGLYTSPHLKDFSERIKINGKEIDHNYVVDFVHRTKSVLTSLQPSFFELTTALAFEYFAIQQVDIAVIEVGLGGRLDSTNVITPELSLITNIGYDHMDILGDTLPKIALEKAGIIKSHVPVVISETHGETAPVFRAVANKQLATITFASDYINCRWLEGNKLDIRSPQLQAILQPQLKGHYQAQNIAGVLSVCLTMRELNWLIPDTAIFAGIQETITITGLKGRWQVLQQKPLVIADTGHNAEGIQQLIDQVAVTPHDKLHWVYGMVKDKDPNKVLSILPKRARYYFCQASSERALDADQLFKLAMEHGLTGMVVRDVNAAMAEAKKGSQPNDLIMVGGSTFVVAEISNL